MRRATFLVIAFGGRVSARSFHPSSVVDSIRARCLDDWGSWPRVPRHASSQRLIAETLSDQAVRLWRAQFKNPYAPAMKREAEEDWAR